MNERKTPPIRNFVAKHAAEFCKPKTFRNRKKEYVRKQKYEAHELEHPKHKPYERDRYNYLLDEELAEDQRLREAEEAELVRQYYLDMLKD